MTSYLVLDIETIPDREIAPLPPPEIERIDIPSKPNKTSIAFFEEVLSRLAENRPVHTEDIDKAIDIGKRMEPAPAPEALAKLSNLAVDPEPEKPPMAPIYAQIPVAIGCVWLDADLFLRKIGCMTNSEGRDGEKKLLSAWNDFMQKETPSPTLVTWAGRTFDLPVLQYRSFKHGIPMPWYFDERDYKYRYTEARHTDLCDVMADFGATRFSKLDAIAPLIGLPGKHDDMDGSKVEAMFGDGLIDDIAAYCTDDTLQTAFIFLRWRLLRGRITKEHFERAASLLLEQTPESLKQLINTSALLSP